MIFFIPRFIIRSDHFICCPIRKTRPPLIALIKSISFLNLTTPLAISFSSLLPPNAVKIAVFNPSNWSVKESMRLESMIRERCSYNKRCVSPDHCLRSESSISCKRENVVSALFVDRKRKKLMNSKIYLAVSGFSIESNSISLAIFFVLFFSYVAWSCITLSSTNTNNGMELSIAFRTSSWVMEIFSFVFNIS